MFGSKTILAAGGLRGFVRILDVAHQSYLKPVCNSKEKNKNNKFFL
jgi:hypothetical protein